MLNESHFCGIGDGNVAAWDLNTVLELMDELTCAYDTNSSLPSGWCSTQCPQPCNEYVYTSRITAAGPWPESVNDCLVCDSSFDYLDQQTILQELSDDNKVIELLFMLTGTIT